MLLRLFACRFKWETFYGWHPSDGNFTNIAQSPSPKGLVEFYNETGKPGILELEGVFFTGAAKPLRGMVMKPGGAEAWKAMIPTLQPLVDQKIIVGFMLGDEIVWNGVSWKDLNSTAALVKNAFPDPFLSGLRSGQSTCDKWAQNRDNLIAGLGITLQIAVDIFCIWHGILCCYRGLKPKTKKITLFLSA